MIGKQKCGRNCCSVHRTEKVYAPLRSVQSRRPPDVLHPGRAQRQLLMDGTAVKRAFALLSAKVTKPMCLSAQNMTDKKKWRERCKPIGEND